MPIMNTRSISITNLVGYAGLGPHFATARNIAQTLNLKSFTSLATLILAQRIHYEGAGQIKITVTPAMKKVLPEISNSLLGKGNFNIEDISVTVIDEPRSFIKKNSLLLSHAAVLLGGTAAYCLSPDVKESVHSFLKWYEDWNNSNLWNPWIGSMVKFAIGGTYGKMLGDRIREGKWDLNPKKLISEVLYWGPMGTVILAAFKIIGGGMESLSNALPILSQVPLLKAAASSYTLNTLIYPHLVNLHPYYDKYVAEGDNSPVGIVKFLAEGINHKYWDKEYQKDWRPAAHWFWNPYQTITFLLKKEFQRIAMAAAGAVILGIDMGLRARKK